MSGIPSTGCSSPYTGNPVHQTQWIIINSGSWREIGTGHQCNDTYRYWFWGYGLNGTWVSLGYQTGITNGQVRTFEIRRSLLGHENRHVFLVGGAAKANLVSDATGIQVEAGLESYAANANVVYHSYGSLQYQKNNGAFAYWAGKDASSVGSSMCGSWGSSTQWNAGQGGGC